VFENINQIVTFCSLDSYSLVNFLRRTLLYLQQLMRQVDVKITKGNLREH